jgi:hypothetical protein
MPRLRAQNEGDEMRIALAVIYSVLSIYFGAIAISFFLKEKAYLCGAIALIVSLAFAFSALCLFGVIE